MKFACNRYFSSMSTENDNSSFFTTSALKCSSEVRMPVVVTGVLCNRAQWPRLFKCWIALFKHLINHCTANNYWENQSRRVLHRHLCIMNFFQASLRNCINCVHCDDHFFIFTEIYLVDNIIHLLNNLGPALGSLARQA